MIRTQIQLTEVQAERLRHIAHERGASIAGVIRDAIDRFLASEPTASWEQRRARAMSVVGKYATADSDVAERHDAR